MPEITPAEEARRDSLAAYMRALYKAQREGKPAPPPLPPRNPPPAQNPPVPPPRQQTPPDTSGLPTISPER